MPLHNYLSSPLRYPGGKTRFSPFLEDVILLNNLEGCTLYELYAGGAGASLNLLFSGLCDKIVLNDLDYHVYAFWHSILKNTDKLLELIQDTEVTVDNWQIQREIYNNYKDFEIELVGFATFFLNRTNRSGILHRAGPIGGKNQTGNYKIDVRYNKPDLISRINLIASNKEKITLHNIESISLLNSVFNSCSNDLIFLDPPYYNQGEKLYLNFYNDEDHVSLSNILHNNKQKNWVLTYDNCERINELYSNNRIGTLPMSYTLQSKKQAKEVLVVSDSLQIPKKIRLGNKSLYNNFKFTNNE